MNQDHFMARKLLESKVFRMWKW